MATQWRRTGSGCMLHRHAADDGDGDAEHESFAGDLVLKVGDAHTLRAHSALLAMASRPLANALRCGSCSASGPACLEVQGAPDGWRQLLRFLLHPAMAGRHQQLTASQAYQILPIAHEYAMEGLVRSCVEAVAQQFSSSAAASLKLPSPLGQSAPAAAPSLLNLLSSSSTTGKTVDCMSASQTSQSTPASAGQHSQPGLLKWLALADDAQCLPLLHLCLEQLVTEAAGGTGATQGSSTGLPDLKGSAGSDSTQAHAIVRSLLAARHSRLLLQRLRPTSLLELLNVVLQLPADFQGVQVPDLTLQQPVFRQQVSAAASCGYRAFCSRLHGHLLLLPDLSSNTVQLLDMQGPHGSCLRLEGHTSAVTAVDFCCAPDASASYGGSGDWGCGPGCCLDSSGCGDNAVGAAGCVSCLAAEPRHALSGSRDGSVKVWDLAAAGRCCLTLGRYGDEILSACSCGEARNLAACACSSGIIRVWDISAATDVTAAAAAGPGAGSGTSGARATAAQSNGHNGGTGGVAFLEGHQGPVVSLSSSYDGRLLCSASADGTARLWDLRGSQRRCVRLLQHKGTVWSACLDGRGSTAVTGCADGAVRVWDMGSGRCSSELRGHEESAVTAQVDSAGAAALSLGWDKAQRPGGCSIRLWDLSQGQQARKHLPSRDWACGGKVLHLGASGDLSRVVAVVDTRQEQEQGQGQLGGQCELRVWAM